MLIDKPAEEIRAILMGFAGDCLGRPESAGDRYWDFVDELIDDALDKLQGKVKKAAPGVL